MKSVNLLTNHKEVVYILCKSFYFVRTRLNKGKTGECFPFLSHLLNMRRCWKKILWMKRVAFNYKVKVW